MGAHKAGGGRRLKERENIRGYFLEYFLVWRVRCGHIWLSKDPQYSINTQYVRTELLFARRGRKCSSQVRRSYLTTTGQRFLTKIRIDDVDGKRVQRPTAVYLNRRTALSIFRCWISISLESLFLIATRVIYKHYLRISRTKLVSSHVLIWFASMGVPKFFRWLSERYPLINQVQICLEIICSSASCTHFLSLF